MGRQDFIDQLRELRYDVESLGEERIAFRYIVPVGRFEGQEIKLGFVVPGDFPLTPPSGPYISPRLREINTVSREHPAGGVSDAPAFGPEWQYWSRPHRNWDKTDRTVRSYMAHIRALFETQ
jgi:Prokaryotic E2 family E